MLPRLSGLDVLKLVRLESDLPVIILSARVSEAERISGLQLGADDYIVKPYSPREVVERVRAVLRRAAGGRRRRRCFRRSGGGRRTAGGVARRAAHPHDPQGIRSAVPDGPIPEAFTRSSLLEDVWGYAWAGPTDTGHRPRPAAPIKDRADPSRPRHLVTVYGVGYRFEP